MQYFIVAVTLMLAVGYAAWRIHQVVHSKRNPCDGCSGCALKQQRLKAQQTKKRPPCHKDKEAVM